MGKTDSQSVGDSTASGVRVLVAAAEPLFRSGIRYLAESPGSGIRVVADTDDGSEVLEIANSRAVDVYMLALRLRTFDAVEVLDRLRWNNAEPKMIIIGSTTRLPVIRRVLTRRPHGYILSNVNLDRVSEAIHRVHAGESYLATEIESHLARVYSASGSALDNEPPGTLLTPRQEEICRRIGLGMNTRQIAGELSVSRNTVRAHVANIMGRLDLHSVRDLVRYAIHMGLVADASEDDRILSGFEEIDLEQQKQNSPD
jgi:DNA-binding NarL/FixJ family response regulator